jgi:hypothetical protein
MENETKKSGSVDVTVALVLFSGCLYGLHQNYQDFVFARMKPDTGWIEKVVSTALYILGAIGLACLILVDKLAYNAKFHTTVIDWWRSMHPNGDMIAFGSLIFALCVVINQVLRWTSRNSD